MNQRDDDRSVWLVVLAIGTFSLWYVATERSQNPLWLIIAALAAFAVAYRFYGPVVLRAARVSDAPDDDGVAESRGSVWTLGYHFAAIAGAGALIAPVAVVQYGFLPALLWILIGASLAGAVHDFVALLASGRRAGRLLPQIARDELGPIAASAVALLSLLTLIVVLSAVAGALLDLMARDSGVTYALILTVPSALFVVLYAQFLRPGHREEAAAVGLILFALAVIVGSRAGSTSFMRLFLMSRRSLVVLLAAYCLGAALLPIGALSLVRGALSGYLILGATGLMAVFVAFVAPSLQIGPTSSMASGGGFLPMGRVFPTVGLVLAVGVISGFHALIASGPTAQLVRHERQVLPLGFGSMLLVGFLCLLVVAVTATLAPADYLAINTPLPPEKITEAVGASPTVVHQLREPLGQSVAARPGSPATLAVGIVQAYRTLSKADPARFRPLYRLVNVLAALLLFAALEAGVRATWLLARGWSLTPVKGGSPRQVVSRLPPLRLRAGDWLSVTLDWSRILGGPTTAETPDQEAVARRSGLFVWGVTLVVTVVWAALSVGVAPRFSDPIIGVSSLLLAGSVLCLSSVLVMRLHAGRGRWLVLVTTVPALVVLLTGLVGGIDGMRDLWTQARPEEAFSTAFGELPILAAQQELIPVDRAWAIVREMPAGQASEAFAAGGHEGLAQALSARFGESVPQAGLRLADLVISRARALTLWGRLQVVTIVLAVILTLIVVSGLVAPTRTAAEEVPTLPEPRIDEQGMDEPWPGIPSLHLPTVPGGQLLRGLIRPGEEDAVREIPPSLPVEELVGQDLQQMERERLSGVSLISRILLFGASISLSLRGSWVLYHNRGAFFTTVLFYTVALVCLRLAFYEGLWQPWSVRHGLATLGQKVRAHRWELLCLGLIFGVAVFFRVYRFGYFPPANGVAFEEAQAGGDAFKVLRYGHRTVEFPVTVYLPALSFALLGESTITLRLPFLILGCLTVAPFYLLLRELVDYRAALFGAFLLAVSRWHAVVSRIADELFVPIFFEALILYLVVKTGKGRKIRYYFWLAILSAYMLYAYTAYRVIPFLVLLVFIGRFLKSVIGQVWQRRGIVKGLRTILGTGWQPALVFVVTFLTVAGPLLVVTRQSDRFFVEAFVRASASGGGGTASSLLTAQALDRLKNAMLILTHKGASYPGLNIPGEPMLDPVSRVLFVLGVIYSLITFFRPYRLWLLLWIVAVLAVGSLFPPNLYVGRFSNLIPIVFIIISFMVGDSGRVARRWGVRPQRLFSAFLVLLAAAVLILNYRTLFERQISHPDVRRAYQNRVVALCNYAGSLPGDTYVYVWDRDQLLEYVFLPSDFVWACHDMRGEAVSDMRAVLPARVQAEQVGYIFVNPTESVDELSQLIGRYYPQTQAPSTVIEGEQGSYRIVVYLVDTSSVRVP